MGNMAMLDQSGDENTSYILQGSAGVGDFNTAYVDQSGSYNDSYVSQLNGNDNKANVNQSGTYGESNVLQNGNSNFADISQSGEGDISWVIQNGDNKSATVEQSGVGVPGAEFNESFIIQSGAGAHTAYVIKHMLLLAVGITFQLSLKLVQSTHLR